MPPAAAAGPTVRLIPATPEVVDEVVRTILTNGDEVVRSVITSPQRKKGQQQEVKLVVEEEVVSPGRSSRTPLISRSNTATSDTVESVGSGVTAVSSMEFGRAPSARSVGGWRPRALAGLRRSNSDKVPARKRSIKMIKKGSTVKRSATGAVKHSPSVRSADLEASPCGSSHLEARSTRSARSSFYRVIDRLRQLGRRTSSTSSASGQVDFLDSLTKISDSRIVENWLLSLDEESAAPVEEMLESSMLSVEETPREEGITPTNELVEQEEKVAGAKPDQRMLFQLPSSEEDESAEECERRRRPSSAPPRPPGFGRQMSECSEYTTDTHDTGETAQVTARNTITNTNASFTSVGDVIRKGAGQEAQYSPCTEEVEAADLEVAAINLERLELESLVTSRSSETTVYTSSSVREEGRRRGRRGSGGSDGQGSQGPS